MPDATLHPDGPISVVTLNRPNRLNAIGGQLLADLHLALQQAQGDPHTRVIVFTGAGRAFCAGDDLQEFGEQARSPASVAQVCEDIQRITQDLMFGPKLVIGAVHGYAVGGGFEYALAIPNQLPLLGLVVRLQAYAFAPGVNAAETIVSNRLDWRVGDA